MRKLYFVASLIFVIIFITGCGVNKADAEKVASGYFEAIKNNDFETAVTFYSSRFLEKSSQEESLQALKSMKRKFGDLQSYKLNEWKINTVAGIGTGENGTYYNFRYVLTYTIETANVDLTLFKAASGGEIKINGYNINSSALLK
jgi:hypothetical protein